VADLERLAAPVTPHLLVDARPLNGARNGITRFVEQLVAAWPEAPGFRTTLISNRPVRSNAMLPTGIECFHDDHPLSRLPGTLWMTLRVPALALRLGATHFLGTQHVLPLWRTGRLTQGVIVHDLVFELYPGTMATSNRLLSGFFAPRSIKRADRIFCVSETTRADLRQHFGDVTANALVCYPGRTVMTSDCAAVPVSAGPEFASGAGIGLLVVGSIEPRKNVARFLEAFLLASDQEPRLHLDLVSGDTWGDVLGEAAWAKVLQHPRIRIHQRISDESLRGLYEAADYLVFPSLYEGFGLPILEAVGYCAVIANDIPVFREIASRMDGMRLMDLQAEPSEIARHLVTLAGIDPPKAADDRGAFSWERSVGRMLEALDLPLTLTAPTPPAPVSPCLMP
jgi:glycosyltransferase involved in cell wall biosynthesis